MRRQERRTIVFAIAQFLSIFALYLGMSGDWPETVRAQAVVGLMIGFTATAVASWLTDHIVP